MTKCDEMFIFLNLELDGELTPDEQKQLDEHRATCPTCQARTFELRQMSSAVRDLDATPSEGFHDRVLAQIAQEQKTAKKVIPFTTYVRRYGGIAACALLCVGLFQMGLHQNETGMDEPVSPMSISDVNHAEVATYTGDVMPREARTDDDTAIAFSTVSAENILLIDTMPEEMPEGVPTSDEWIVSSDRAPHCYVSRETWVEMCDTLGVQPADYENDLEGKYVIELNEDK